MHSTKSKHDHFQTNTAARQDANDNSFAYGSLFNHERDKKKCCQSRFQDNQNCNCEMFNQIAAGSILRVCIQLYFFILQQFVFLFSHITTMASVFSSHYITKASYSHSAAFYVNNIYLTTSTSRITSTVGTLYRARMF